MSRAPERVDCGFQQRQSGGGEGKREDGVGGGKRETLEKTCGTDSDGV